MRKTILNIGLAVMTTALITSCNKYEDGPAVSLLTKKSRVANTWVIDKAMQGDEEETSSYDEYELYLTKDGNAELKASYQFGGVNVSTESKGDWDFESDKEFIKFDFENDELDGSFEILKLESDEFWYYDEEEDLEIQLKEK